MSRGTVDGERLLEKVRSAISRHLTIPGTTAPLLPYPEQLAAARAMLGGAVAEMATGEGKTIAASFVAAAWAPSGPVHIATANAYLAARDAALLRPVYAALGHSTGAVLPDMPASARRVQYRRDIVYGTLAEFGFDYLRDRLVLRAADRVQVRGLDALIVDEADLLLIDEARTPLVIAESAGEPPDAVLPRLAPLVEQLVTAQAERIAGKVALLAAVTPGSFDAAVLAAQLRRAAPRHPAVLDLFSRIPAAARGADRAERELRGSHAATLEDGLLFCIDEPSRTAYFTAEGQARIEAHLGPLFERADVPPETLAALHNLLLAYALFERDRDYLLRDDSIVLIEPATGRAAAGRRYMRGLHDAIEARELGTPSEPTVTRAQISVQQLARQYRRRAGMTGTAVPAAAELATIYGMPTVVIPRHQPNRRVDLPPLLYRTAAAADAAVVDAIARAHRLGRPVLAGTQDLARSEGLSALLAAAGIPHTVLTARDHSREAAIVAEAGAFGAVTVATTMAGRGTDIRLADGLQQRLLRQAVERAAAGPVVFDCVSDETRDRLAAALGDAAVTCRVAGRHISVRGGTDGDRLVLALGLEVIAVGPALDRRLDDQLRGRGGRQGDEGVTRLFAALDDEVLRHHGAAGVRARALAALDRRPFLTGRAAARVIEDAQDRAARVHAGQRQRLFAFDQVLEAQRQAMLAGYEAVLAEADLDRAIEAFIPDVAAGIATWQAAATDYGAVRPRAGTADADPQALAAALAERYQRARAESGDTWVALARAALLRAATDLWSLHVDRTEHLQRQAPALYGFLPGPPEIPYAREAGRHYEDYRWSVKAETLATLLTLPQRYERARDPADPPAVSNATRQLLSLIERQAGDDQRPGEDA